MLKTREVLQAGWRLYICSLCLGLGFHKWVKPVLPPEATVLPSFAVFGCQFLHPNCPLVLA